MLVRRTKPSCWRFLRLAGINEHRVLALEGLPGAGKTSLMHRIKLLFPDIAIVPEVVLASPPRPDRHFFARNDMVRVFMSETSGAVVLDRSWMSTAAYVIAESRRFGRDVYYDQIVQDLYGGALRVHQCAFLSTHPEPLP